MTPQPDNDRYLDQLHRDEITVAMNWVIRTCQDIVREWSHRSFWTPTGIPTGTTPTTDHLIHSARTDVLNKLRHQIDGAEAIITNAEHERAKRQQ
ncbi:hypothetical protein [Streptomyces sp. Rer75]|uniref:hypothetical protein n=1 Tax=Streptomyces sp. Rer75 TaxID=2750011 RepID=UPI0015D07E03|nr:hypothetical protein [Streptomyces sp. Rer75]QLH23092.1 hypothetical protein HYQ63_22725 [Streptomyces sp. Rer75]